MSSLSRTTTVRLDPALRHEVDRAAHRAGISRSEYVRRALRRLVALGDTDPNASHAWLDRHQVVFSLPVVRDELPSKTKAAIACRNAAAVNGECECGARPEPVGPLVVGAHADLTAAATASRPRAARPSASLPTPPSQRRSPTPITATVRVAFDHAESCPARGGTP